MKAGSKSGGASQRLTGKGLPLTPETEDPSIAS